MSSIMAVIRYSTSCERYSKDRLEHRFVRNNTISIPPFLSSRLIILKEFEETRVFILHVIVIIVSDI